MRIGGLVALAFGGSAVFGASLVVASDIPAWKLATWMVVCAGLGWAALIPALSTLSRQPWGAVIERCLVTIAYGECVLLLGAISNVAIGRPDALIRNAAVILLSNIVMGAVLIQQMSGLGLSAKRTLSAWVFALDGVGVAAFWLTSRLLGGA